MLRLVAETNGIFDVINKDDLYNAFSEGLWFGISLWLRQPLFWVILILIIGSSILGIVLRRKRLKKDVKTITRARLEAEEEFYKEHR